MRISPANYFGGLHLRLASLYECNCEDCKKINLASSPLSEEDNFKSVLKAAENAFKHLHSQGGYSAENINDEPYRKLTEATAKVFDGAIADNKIPPAMLAKLQNDAFIFSGLKTHAQLMEAGTLLLDKDGKVRSFDSFAHDFNKINKNYNQNYLQAEHQFAVSSSQSAANWAALNENGRYNLQYRTAADDRVRASHQPLHNTTLPKDDAFWMSYYPPNGWRCRCVVVEVLKSKYEVSDSAKAIAAGEKATSHIGKDGKNKLEIFRFNPGAQQKVFPPKHPYNKVKGADEVKKKIAPKKAYNEKDEKNVIDLIGDDLERFKNKFKEQISKYKLADIEGYSIHEYTRTFYKYINEKLRNGETDEQLKSYIKIADAAMKKLPVFKGEVYRGTHLPADILKSLQDAHKSGKPHTELAFMSTSSDPSKAFEGSTVFKIKSKNGREIKEISEYGKSEDEILFMPGTKFKVTKITGTYGKNEIHLEEL